MTPRVLWMALVSVATLLGTGCDGDENIAARYDAERLLWHATNDGHQLPGRALADSGHAVGAHAAQLVAISQGFESWVRDRPLSPVREDMVALAATARWRAYDRYVAIADSVALAEILDHFATTPNHMAADVTRALRRRADIAATDRDPSARLADLRRLWSIVRGGDRSAYEWISVPAEIVETSAQTGDALAVDTDREWALREYEELGRRGSERGRTNLHRIALLHRAELLSEAGRFDEAAAELVPTVRRILAQLRPDGDAIRFVARATEIRLRAVAAGALDPTRLEDSLDFLIEKSTVEGRVHAALLDALATRGDGEAALDVARLLRRKFDDAKWGPYVTRAEARIYASSDRWKQAEVALDLLRSRYTMTEDALAAPVEVVRIAIRRGATLEASEILESTVETLRDLLVRYPRGPQTPALHFHLAQALELQGDTAEAFDVLLRWVEPVRNTAAELARLDEAVRTGRRMLRPENEVRPHVQRIAALFPHTRRGERAARELASTAP